MELDQEERPVQCQAWSLKCYSRGMRASCVFIDDKNMEKCEYKRILEKNLHKSADELGLARD